MSEMYLEDLAVLIVEPSKAQRQALTRFLEAQEIRRIDEAASGKEALEAMHRSDYQLVISAMYLPDMTATELITTLRDSTTQADTPFMLVSSEARQQLLEPIRQAGVIAMLPKPFDEVDLRRALLNTLQFINPDTLESDLFDPSRLRVLVVDDVAYARAHVSLVLKSLGISNISAAEDGEQAVSLLYSQDFDLIVTDYNMPNMDGKELTEWIRSERADFDTPILMVTSESNESRLSAIHQSGVSAVCDKPFAADTVKQFISQALQA